MAGESANQDSPMLLDVTGIAMVAKLQDIASAISAGGGGGGGGGSIKRCPTIINTKRKNCFTASAITAPQVNGVPANLIGKYVWVYTDFINHYNDRFFYNNGNTSYEIHVGDREIENKTWDNVPYHFGDEPENIWNDGTDIYFSSNWGHYKLDIANNRWTSVSTSTLGKSFKGSEVWTDGTDIYVTSNTSSPYNYVLDRTTGKFIDKNWDSIPSNFVAKNVWRDEIDSSLIRTYYSNGSVQYELDAAHEQWVTKTWTGMTNFYGRYVWCDRDNSYIYYSYQYNSTNTQKVLDTNNDEWNDKSWENLTSFSAENIWYDEYRGDKYYSNGSIQYEMYSDEWYDMDYNDDEWGGVTKTFNQAFSNSNLKNCIWTDGKHIYFSSGKLSAKNQYVYNKTSGEWDPVTWYAYDSSYNSVDIYMNGCDIWTDGSRIFVSNHQNNANYIISSIPEGDYSSGELNVANIKDSSSNDLLFDGNCVWTDGKTIYLSYYHDYEYSDQYVLTGNYDNDGYIFASKIWDGPTGFNSDNLIGYQIWTDGENIYHSGEQGQYSYVLNETTGKWESKSWYNSNNNLMYIEGNDVWTDGKDIFYHDGSYEYGYYVLDKATGMWGSMVDDGVSSNGIIPSNIWSDGEKIFVRGYSNIVYVVKSSRNTTLTLHT